MQKVTPGVGAAFGPAEEALQEVFSRLSFKA